MYMHLIKPMRREPYQKFKKYSYAWQFHAICWNRLTLFPGVCYFLSLHLAVTPFKDLLTFDYKAMWLETMLILINLQDDQHLFSSNFRYM